MSAYVVELLGILIALGLLILLAFRGFRCAPRAAAILYGSVLHAKLTS
jgi:hypothetical protein